MSYEFRNTYFNCNSYEVFKTAKCLHKNFIRFHESMFQISYLGRGGEITQGWSFFRYSEPLRLGGILCWTSWIWPGYGMEASGHVHHHPVFQYGVHTTGNCKISHAIEVEARLCSMLTRYEIPTATCLSSSNPMGLVGILYYQNGSGNSPRCPPLNFKSLLSDKIPTTRHAFSESTKSMRCDNTHNRQLPEHSGHL